MLNHIQDKLGLELHVIDCLGKGNIPTFAKILNKFDVPYIVIHDSDSPRVRRKGQCINSGMWTVNSKIRLEVSKSLKGRIYTQIPHFEGEFFGETLSSGKVANIIEIIQDAESQEYINLVEVYSKILNDAEDMIFTSTEDKFMTKFYAYIEDKTLLSDPELWDLSPTV